MRVEYNINKVQNMSYPLAQYGLLDVRSPVAPGLTDDPMLTAENIKTFKRTFKELYDFS
jgi:hypothetical protein